MKRTIVGVAVVAGLVQLNAIPAQAAPEIDPVKALKAALVRGQAVNIVATVKADYGHGVSLTSGMDGTIGFGPRGEIASDLSQTLRYSKTAISSARKLGLGDDAELQQTPVRTISSAGDDYVSGPVVDEALPQDTSWVRYRDTDLPASNMLLEVLEPGTLKALLISRTSYSDGVLKGTIKADKLAKVSRSFASRFGKPSKAANVSYTLWFSGDGLVERVAAKAVLPSRDGSLRVESDTRYSAWGRQVTILLPLEGDVIDRDQLGDKAPRQVPGVWS
ncbi:hypothetical protein E1286_33960 [Nonomuraea terrae]|uniref:DUF2092 domain-containing protein n=1 Tax=Nonomuraea terrae TaxID=2530383 RepID=A0A4R4YAM6_9ACTN|nr:hypothetical protein [Nonomuraea terrae]TDD40809.1 hypothetical protein E1286_33960 [Nonomuraea terrae]